MDLSVIVISYNEIEYLPQAISSCLEQRTDYKYEIIIGDDGSTDGSLELIDEYASRYPEIIRYFVMDRSDIANVSEIIPSVRVTKVIKRGLDIAQGTNVLILSGDDFFCDDTLFERNLSILSKGKYTVCCNAFQFYCENEYTNPVYPYNVSAKLLWSASYVHISSLMFNRKLADEDKLVHYFSDDTGLVYVLTAFGKWHYDNIVSFSYRQRKHSIMHKTSRVELDLIELILLQDCLNNQKLKYASYSKFWFSLFRLLVNNQYIDDEKFKKYKGFFPETSKGIYHEMMNWRTSSLLTRLFLVLKILWMFMFRIYYQSLFMVVHFVNKVCAKNCKG